MLRVVDIRINEAELATIIICSGNLVTVIIYLWNIYELISLTCIVLSCIVILTLIGIDWSDYCMIARPFDRSGWNNNRLLAIDYRLKLY